MFHSMFWASAESPVCLCRSGGKCGPLHLLSSPPSPTPAPSILPYIMPIQWKLQYSLAATSIMEDRISWDMIGLGRSNSTLAITFVIAWFHSNPLLYLVFNPTSMFPLFYLSILTQSAINKSLCITYSCLLASQTNQATQRCSTVHFLSEPLWASVCLVQINTVRFYRRSFTPTALALRAQGN